MTLVKDFSIKIGNTGQKLYNTQKIYSISLSKYKGGYDLIIAIQDIKYLFLMFPEILYFYYKCNLRRPMSKVKLPR